METDLAGYVVNVKPVDMSQSIGYYDAKGGNVGRIYAPLFVGGGKVALKDVTGKALGEVAGKSRVLPQDATDEDGILTSEGTGKTTTKIDYKEVFFEQNPELRGEVVVHHGIEQQVLKRPETKGLFTETEIHSYDNLRGIPKEVNSDIHLSQIRKEWNRFYKENPNPTKEQLLQKRLDIDKKYGDQFNPPIKQEVKR